MNKQLTAKEEEEKRGREHVLAGEMIDADVDDDANVPPPPLSTLTRLLSLGTILVSRTTRV